MKVDIGNYTNVTKKKRVVKVKIENWDTWSIDHTLALIILPLLKKYRKNLNGCHYVYNKDVPNELKFSTNSFVKQVDEDHEKCKRRWEYIIDQMIYSFQRKVNDEWPEFYIDKKDTKAIKEEYQKIQNGYNLFAKYYDSLWN